MRPFARFAPLRRGGFGDPTDALRAVFERRCERDGRDPDTELAAVLDADADAETFWEQAGANLKAGRIRLVFVARVSSVAWSSF